MEMVFNSVIEAINYTGKKFHRNFNLDDPARLLNYRKVFHCLSGSPTAGELDMNPNKGILFIGDKGVGKSICMRTMQVLFKNSPRRFKWIDVYTIIDMLREKYCSEAEIKEMYGKGLKCDLYIDDLGFGNPTFHSYKNETNIIAELIWERDELFVLDGYRTHFSSNIKSTVPDDSHSDRKSLERLYGDRILDRIKQLTNLIVWEGKSLRSL